MCVCARVVVYFIHSFIDFVLSFFHFVFGERLSLSIWSLARSRACLSIDLKLGGRLFLDLLHEFQFERIRLNVVIRNRLQILL